MENTFTVMHGRHTFDTSSTKIACFVHKRGKKVNEREFVSNHFDHVGTTRFPAAINHEAGANHGGWTQYVFPNPEDYEILGFQITKTYRGCVAGSCTLLVVLDPEGPLIQVNAIPTVNTNAYCKKVPVFLGKGYVIDHRTAKDYGVKFTRNYISAYLYDVEELEDTFEVVTLKVAASGNTEPLKPTQVKTRDGSVKTVLIKDPPKRRVKVRKRKG
ncbi:MAG: hypothetical protein KAJ73_00445 [Zetaproteobacteria bacterium]|nr:hypothetical protein [Zetaproteobacteria bacterium]